MVITRKDEDGNKIPVKVRDKILNSLSVYSGLDPETKSAIKGILSEIARADEEVDLSEKDVQFLLDAWEHVCNSEEIGVPLVVEDKVEQFLEDKLE